jgi:hypothetical protein
MRTCRTWCLLQENPTHNKGCVSQGTIYSLYETYTWSRFPKLPVSVRDSDNSVVRSDPGKFNYHYEL